MIKVFVDTDVILDLLLDRGEFAKPAYRIFKRIEFKEIEGCTSPLAIANIHYILSKSIGKKDSLELIRNLLSILKVTRIDGNTIAFAFEDQKMKDLEDLIQLHSAIEEKAGFFVTRNLKDFPKTKGITVLPPDELLHMIEANEQDQ